MGYMIHFDEDSVGADELKLLETKKAILEKLQARFGFGDMTATRALAAAPTATAKGLPSAHAPQLRAFSKMV
jgi:hypothetical protein